MRVGGFTAGGLVGLGVGLGVSVAVGGVVMVGLGVAVGGSGVGLGPVLGAVERGVGVLVGVEVLAGAGVAVAGTLVGRSTAAVTASTTAPASVNSGSGGRWTHWRTPQPAPVRIIKKPTSNKLLDRTGTCFLISTILFKRQPLVKPRYGCSGLFGITPAVRLPLWPGT